MTPEERRRRVTFLLLKHGWCSLRQLSDSILGEAHGAELDRQKSAIYGTLKSIGARSRPAVDDIRAMTEYALPGVTTATIPPVEFADDYR